VNSEPGCENRCCTTCRTTARRLRLLTICFAVFVVLHALIIPLLPKLFDAAPAVGVAALVLGVVAVALIATRRIGPYS
jgi:predicted membrane channel-forming protein YqfA (hemolysin III family)